MTAEITGKDSDWCEARLPIARGFQFVQIWWAKRKVACVKPGTRNDQTDAFARAGGFA